MPRGKTSKPLSSKRKTRTPMSAEARESQLISLAIDLAEQQLRDGTASSQVITHYLKLGSSKDKLERQILEKQKDLIGAKTKAYQSSEKIEKLYADALEAFRQYGGYGKNEGDSDDPEL